MKVCQITAKKSDRLNQTGHEYSYPAVDQSALRSLRILLRIAIEFICALQRAEIEGLALVFSRSFGIFLCDLHSAYGIGVSCTGHGFPPNLFD